MAFGRPKCLAQYDNMRPRVGVRTNLPIRVRHVMHMASTVAVRVRTRPPIVDVNRGCRVHMNVGRSGVPNLVQRWPNQTSEPPRQ